MAEPADRASAATVIASSVLFICFTCPSHTASGRLFVRFPKLVSSRTGLFLASFDRCARLAQQSISVPQRIVHSVLREPRGATVRHAGIGKEKEAACCEGVLSPGHP